MTGTTPPLDDVLRKVIAWAQTRADIRAVALAGSYARNAPRPDSDIDLVLLVVDPSTYMTDQRWQSDLDWAGANLSLKNFHDACYGACASRHAFFTSGLEIEFGFVALNWATCDPVDSGTKGIVAGGFRVLHDPDMRFAKLLQVC